MATVSVHNGAQVSRDHNIRNRRVTDKEPHIDPKGHYEIWVDEKARDAYLRLFGAAQDRYNAKQKRADRRISSYYNEVAKSADQNPVYEVIVGVYPGERKDLIDPDKARQALRTFLEEWSTRNPNLEVIGAYYHADEQGEPHLHIDYVPVAHGYKRGLDTQAGLVKAFGEMGFYTLSGKQTAQIQWEARERRVFTEICKELGFTIEAPTQEKRQHLDTATYKAEKHLESTIDHYNDMERLAGEQVKRAAKADARAQKAVERAGRAADAEQSALEHKKALQGEIRALQGEYSEQVGIQAKTAGKTLLGKPKANIEIPYTDYQALIARANAVDDMRAERERLERERKALAKERAYVEQEREVTARKDREHQQTALALEKRERNLDKEVRAEAEKLSDNLSRCKSRFLKDRGLSEEYADFEKKFLSEQKTLRKSRGVDR